MDELVKSLPEIIKQAATSTLGILALMIIGLAILAFFFFRGASEIARVIIFVMLFFGVVAFGAVVMQQAKIHRLDEEQTKIHRLDERIEAREPLAVSVEDNPARIGAFSDLPIYGVIPADVRTTGSPGPGCDGFRNWLKRNSGVDAGSTKLKIAVQSKVSKPILLSEMRVKILDRLPPVIGIPVTCPTAGEVKYRSIAIDLDAVPPRVKYQYGKESFGFTVQNGETEAFTVVATTTQQHYKWLIELDIVVEGDQRTIEIGSPSAPFETTARQSTESWQWDFQAGWDASVNTPRAGIPKRILAGTPLPPLM
jgi:hypothetical protein